VAQALLVLWLPAAAVEENANSDVDACGHALGLGLGLGLGLEPGPVLADGVEAAVAAAVV
jgi:hypothetical protein